MVDLSCVFALKQRRKSRRDATEKKIFTWSIKMDFMTLVGACPFLCQDVDRSLEDAGSIKFRFRALPLTTRRAEAG